MEKGFLCHFLGNRDSEKLNSEVTQCERVGLVLGPGLSGFKLALLPQTWLGSYALSCPGRHQAQCAGIGI